MAYSAARSLLFNHILSHRVQAGHWNSAIEGDLMMLAGTHSVFAIDTVDDEIHRRINEHDIFPAAPLWGEGKELLSKEALKQQTVALEPWRDWCDALEAHGLQKLYRSMVLLPENLQWNKDIFSFSLPTGAYATTVLRELMAYA
jgi:tRNA pseudouridine13 synthase